MRFLDLQNLQKLATSSRWQEAEKLSRKLLRSQPNEVEVRNFYGCVLMRLDKPVKAQREFEKVLMNNPKHIAALENLGNLHHKLGNSDGAVAAYRRVIEVAPNTFDNYRKLALSKRFRSETDEDLSLILNAASRAETDAAKRSLYFALGKVFDDLQNFTKAFNYLTRANALARRMQSYTVEKDLLLLSWLRQVFSNGWSKRNAPHPDCPNSPLYITGMPRSGTTLIEQLVSQDYAFEPKGELPCLGRIFDQFHRDHGALFKPTQLKDIPLTTRISLGQAYYSCAGIPYKQTGRIIDKTPFNFRLIGFARALFSKPKIILCKRAAGAVALSNFERDFTGGLLWSYDLQDLGKYFAGFEAMIDFWREEPGCNFEEIDFEILLDHPKETISTAATNLGLDDGISRANSQQAARKRSPNSRIISTSSAMQARAPVDRSAADRWRNYENFLEPFFDALAEARKHPLPSPAVQ